MSFWLNRVTSLLWRANLRNKYENFKKSWCHQTSIEIRADISWSDNILTSLAKGKQKSWDETTPCGFCDLWLCELFANCWCACCSSCIDWTWLWQQVWWWIVNLSILDFFTCWLIILHRCRLPYLWLLSVPHTWMQMAPTPNSPHHLLSAVLVVWVCACSSPASACYSCSSNNVSSNGCSKGCGALGEIQVQAIVGSTWWLPCVQPHMPTHDEPLSPSNGDITQQKQFGW